MTSPTNDLKPLTWYQPEVHLPPVGTTCVVDIGSKTSPDYQIADLALNDEYDSDEAEEDEEYEIPRWVWNLNDDETAIDAVADCYRFLILP